MRLEAEDLGIKFTGKTYASGYAECFRIEGENRPSAGFDLTKGRYNAFSGADGSAGQGSESIFDLRARLTGCTVAEAMQYYAARASLATAPLPAKKGTTRPPVTFPTLDVAVENCRQGIVWKEGECRIALKDAYEHANGETAFVIVRIEACSIEPGKTKPAKHIRPFRQNPDGRWVQQGYQGSRPIFRLPRVLADRGPVFVTEGEPCVHVLESLGFVATTSAHGSKSAHQTDWSTLADRDVFILPDHDDDGRAYAETAKKLLGQCQPPARVHIVELPDLELRQDVVDWVQARRDRGESDDQIRAGLRVLIDATRQTEVVRDPEPNPPAAPTDQTTSVILASYSVETDGQGNHRRVGRKASDIHSDMTRITGGWPKRIGSQLFADKGGQPLFLSSVQQLFAWFMNHGQCDWMSRCSLGVSQELFFEYLRQNAESYDALETLPHYPPRPGTFYLHPPVTSRDGALDELVSWFCPATEIDRELIKALIVTPFWGGDPGSRPAFLVTGSTDADERMGRGIGKTTLTQVLGEMLLGGYIDLAVGQDVAELKTRLLSSEGLNKRIVRIDNIKSDRFSWADLEAFVTSSSISGRQLYTGEGARPNNVTVVLTVNGGSLSKDMAERTVCVQLARPPAYSPEWCEQLQRFVRSNRYAIIGDALAFLASEARPYQARSRWASWERAILAKFPNADQIANEIEKRRRHSDGDADDRDEVVAAIEAKLSEYGHDPDLCCFFLPSKITAEWVNNGLNTNLPVNKVSALLGRLTCPQLARSKRGVPGWIWRGKEVPANAKADNWTSVPSAPY